MTLSIQIPVVPPLRDVYRLATLGGSLLDKRRPEATPFFIAVRFIVHAIQHMIVSQRVLEQHFDKPLLITKYHLVVSLAGRRVEGLLVGSGMLWVCLGKIRLAVAVVHIIARTVPLAPWRFNVELQGCLQTSHFSIREYRSPGNSPFLQSLISHLPFSMQAYYRVTELRHEATSLNWGKSYPAASRFVRDISTVR